MPKSATSCLIEPLSFDDENLTQRSVRSLCFAEDLHEQTKITATTTLPTFMMPSHWARDKLTEQDVQKLLHNVPARLLWLCCLVHGLDVIPSCLKPSQTKMTEILVSYRKQAIDALLAFANLRANTTNNITRDTLQDSNDIFISYPTIAFPQKIVYEILQLIPQTPLKSFCVNSIENTFLWQCNNFLPVRLESTDTIILRRLVPYEVWKSSHAKTSQFGIATVPIIVQKENLFFVVSEEGFNMKIQ